MKASKTKVTLKGVTVSETVRELVSQAAKLLEDLKALNLGLIQLCKDLSVLAQ